MTDETVMISRKLIDKRIYPEILAIDDRAWLNLGAGLLAELAAEMIVSQYPDAAIMHYATDEVLIYIPSAAPGYESLRIIVMIKLE